MKNVLWILLVVGCGGQAPRARAPMPDGAPPVVPSVCDEVPVREVDGKPLRSSLDITAAYCAHVGDGCCLPGGGWNCNNANYYEWWFRECPGR